jgi:hypothetical protein
MFEYKINNKHLLFHIVSKIRFCTFLVMEDKYYNFINLALILDNLKVENMREVNNINFQ